MDKHNSNNDNIVIIGDSLIQYYKGNKHCFPDMTLNEFITNDNFILNNLDIKNNDKNNKNITYVFSFGIHDLQTFIEEDDVINNYIYLTKKYNNCMLILPPLQTDHFYEKCIGEIDTIFITAFIFEYKSVDGLHPNSISLKKLKNEIEL